MSSFAFANRMQNVRRSYVREILKVTARPDIISFAGGLPNPRVMPLEAISRAMQAVLESEGRDALQYCTTEGHPPLREWIAKRYATSGGVNVSADQILITTGSQQGLDLLGKVLLDRGDRVIVEQPTYIAAIQAFGMYEPVFESIQIDDDGIDVEQLAQAVRKQPAPKIVYCMPNFQNPSGISYSLERRQRVAQIVGDVATVLIDDDPYGPIRFRGESLAPLGHYLPDRTVLLGTFSKTVSPGLRVGWVCAPPAVMEKLVIAKQAADLHTNNLAQRVVHRFLIDNNFEQHLQTVRAAYRAQCDAMLSAIEKHLPRDIRCTHPEGGMFLWMTLPDGMSATDLFPRAVEKGVAFVPGPAFHANGGGENTMRLNFSNADEAKIEEGIKRLAAAMGRSE
jgi:2-aminoadipate transaminase